MSEASSLWIPAEIWEKILSYIGGRHDLSKVSRLSKIAYAIANPLVYKELEISFCRCSDKYYENLCRTLTENKELAALVKSVFIDLKPQCRITEPSSKDDMLQQLAPFLHGLGQFHFAGQFKDVLGRFKGPQDWHQLSIHTLSKERFLKALSCLVNVERLTYVLGRYQQGSSILVALLRALPQRVIDRLHYLKIGDTCTEFLPGAVIPSNLTTLDLAYVGLDDEMLCSIISQNSACLEVLTLQYVVERTQTSLLSGYRGGPLKKLRAFTTIGPHKVASSGLIQIFGRESVLEQLKLESLSMTSALSWTTVLEELADYASQALKTMKVVSFGAATGCSIFWGAVTHFLRERCGSDLTTLTINGGTKGPSDPFPPELYDYLLDNPQHKLTSFILMWRDRVGLQADQIAHLSNFCSSIETFHFCMAFPINDKSFPASLLTMVAPFKKLQKFHLTFLASSVENDDEEEEVQPSASYIQAIEEVSKDIQRKGPLFDKFVQTIIKSHPDLEEISWSIYRRETFSAEGPKAYIKVIRSEDKEHSGVGSRKDTEKHSEYIDLGAQLRSYGTTNSAYPCFIGSTKTTLNQKPGWHAEMGNPFSKEKKTPGTVEQ